MHLWIHLGLATSVKTALWYLVGDFLADRPEVGTPLSRFDQTEEARYWTGQGRSPYASASVHAPPLLLAFSSPSTVLLADLCSSLLLWAIGRRLLASAGKGHTLGPRAGHLLSSQCHAHGHMFKWWCCVKPPCAAGPAWSSAPALLHMWSPLAALAAAGSSLAVFSNTAVILGLYGAIAGNPVTAAVGIATAVYLDLHPALLTVSQDLCCVSTSQSLPCCHAAMHKASLLRNLLLIVCLCMLLVQAGTSAAPQSRTTRRVAQLVIRHI